MNNKKFMNALLFSAALLSTGMVSSCKDYDDDIDSLNDRVSAVETSIAELQKQIKEGKWVTGFEKSDKGYVLTLSDGNKLEIKNGEKGDTGATGAAGQNGTTWKIDDTTKEWVKVNPDGSEEKTGIIAEGTKGDKGDQGVQGPQGPQGPAGQNGKSPKIESGVWMVWDDEQGKYVEAGSAVGTASYVVEFDAYWELNMVVADAEGNPSTEFAKIVLPKTAEISSLEVYALSEDGKSLGTPNIDLKIGRVKGNQPVEFNGKTYQPGEVLLSKTTNLVAQVNPLKADADKYTFHLVNTKGESKFEVSDATPNLSEAALNKATRAAEAELTRNPGLWNLSLTVPQGAVVEEGNKAVYSLQTNSISNEETLIASRFDITVNVATATSNSPYWRTITLEAGEAVSWAELFEQSLSQPQQGKFEVADYYFEIQKGQLASAEKDGVSLDKNAKTLSVAKVKAGINYIVCHYLTLDGVVKEKNLTINVESNQDIALAEDFNWNFDLDKKTVRVAIEGNDVLDDLISNNTTKTPVYTFAADEVMVDGMPVNKGAVEAQLGAILGDVKFVKERDAETGYNKWYAEMTFDETKVFAESYKAVVEFGDAEKKTLTFNIHIAAPEAYEFVRDNAYFKGNTAKVYPATATQGVSSYDMRVLYKEALDSKEWENISFSDGYGSGNSWFAPKAGNASTPAAIKNEDVNKARRVTVLYRPFNNPNLTASKDEITVEVRSQIFDGTIAYSGALSVSNGIDATLELSKYSFKDQANKAYKLDDSRVASYEVTLADDNAKKYLKLSDAQFSDGKITISRADDTVIVTPQTCKVRIAVKDIWGQTKVFDLNVEAK